MEPGVDLVAITTLFERLRAGANLPELLKELVRLAATPGPSTGSWAAAVLRDGGGPTVMAWWPDAAEVPPQALFDGARWGTQRIEPDEPLARLLHGRGLRRGHRHAFQLDGGLEGCLAVLGADGGPDARTFAAVGEAMAALVHSWNTSRRLRELTERHRLVSQATQHVIYDWDMSTDTLTWTSREAEVFGHPHSAAREHIGWWRSHLHPEDRQRAMTALDRVLKDAERFWTCEYRFRRPDGSYAWVFDRGAVVYDTSVRPLRLLGVMEDISRDRELESRLALASRLAAVGSLASGIAHEINNPLAWVTSNLSFVTEQVKRRAPELDADWAEELTEALDDAQTGATRIAQIVSDLRTFAHADPERLSPVAPRRVVESALTMANNELKHRARVVKRLDPTPMVLANEARLGQAVVNLLLNAAWSAGSPGVAPEVHIGTATDAAGRALIEVSDNGPMVSPDVLPHLFDPFFNARPGGEGIGLGLAVTHSIIASLNGTIDVDSTPGRGTTFRVALPAVPEEVSYVAQPTPLPAARRSVVMVIDDEPAILTAIERMLAPAHEVVGFTDGPSALAAVAKSQPDVIICDVMMPHMSGAQVWASLAASSASLLSRVILLTGGAFTADAQAFVEQCRAPLVDKPFSSKTLRDAVNRVLESAGPR